MTMLKARLNGTYDKARCGRPTCRGWFGAIITDLAPPDEHTRRTLLLIEGFILGENGWYLAPRAARTKARDEYQMSIGKRRLRRRYLLSRPQVAHYDKGGRAVWTLWPNSKIPDLPAEARCSVCEYWSLLDPATLWLNGNDLTPA
jgi:hypothetical protein